MAQAIASERRMRKKLEQINTLSANLLEKVDQFSGLFDADGDNASLLDQIQNTTAKLAELSARNSL
jgi:hypothetical protein